MAAQWVSRHEGGTRRTKRHLAVKAGKSTADTACGRTVTATGSAILVYETPSPNAKVCDRCAKEAGF
jgi:hypothetical protein